MKTITTKTAKNGAQLWYVDGKRTSRVKAAKTSVDNGRENFFRQTVDKYPPRSDTIDVERR